MSAFGHERVTPALLEYRPPTPAMLASVMCHEQKKQAAVCYIGDVLWRVMMFMHPKSEVPIFSRYMQDFGKPVKEQTGSEIVEGLISRLKQRKRAVNTE